MYCPRCKKNSFIEVVYLENNFAMQRCTNCSFKGNRRTLTKAEIKEAKAIKKISKKKQKQMEFMLSNLRISKGVLKYDRYPSGYIRIRFFYKKKVYFFFNKILEFELTVDTSTKNDKNKNEAMILTDKIKEILRDRYYLKNVGRGYKLRNSKHSDPFWVRKENTTYWALWVPEDKLTNK